MHIIKDVLNVSKISITNFRPKSKLRSFALARQICSVCFCSALICMMLLMLWSGGSVSLHAECCGTIMWYNYVVLKIFQIFSKLSNRLVTITTGCNRSYM